MAHLLRIERLHKDRKIGRITIQKEKPVPNTRLRLLMLVSYQGGDP